MDTQMRDLQFDAPGANELRQTARVGVPTDAVQSPDRARTGRLLRTLRIAAGLSVDDAALATEISPIRIRELEAGVAPLEYLEGLVLSKTYLLCATCFSRHFRD